MLQYIVVTPHRGEFPDPITLQCGDALCVGERYEGTEGWDGWYFCTVPGRPGGWVPEQLIARQPDGTGRALADYCARELDVDPGEVLRGSRTLNGWLWCHRAGQGPDASGWVPLMHLQADAAAGAADHAAPLHRA